jgi:threonine dehydrogenase-like Zn-dependent dehydrogenase
MSLSPIWSPLRLDAARRVGADLTVVVPHQDLVSEILDYWGGDNAEFAIDAVGSAETKLLSLDLIEPGGMAVWVGLHQDRISFDSYALTLAQKSIAGSYSGSSDDLRQAAQLVASGVLDTGWVKKFRLEDGENGFREMLEGKGDNIKAILGIRLIVLRLGWTESDFRTQSYSGTLCGHKENLFRIAF